MLILLQLDDIVQSKTAIEIMARTDAPCQFVLANWSEIEEINLILKIPLDATNVMQRNNLTMSDQFGCWLRMEWKLEDLIQTGNLETNLARFLFDNILEKKHVLMENPALCGAIYLDPRFRFELSEANIDSAKGFLLSLYKKVSKTDSAFRDEAQNDQLNQDDSFENRLAKRCSQIPVYNSHLKSNGNPVHQTTMDEDEFIIFLEQYDEKPTRLHHKYSILQYWEENKDEYPELYQLACIVNTIAPTQVSVERAFSTLNWIYSHKRSRLAPELLENILMINLNATLVGKIHQDDLASLKQSNVSDSKLRV